jgi:hypothetical protein
VCSREIRETLDEKSVEAGKTRIANHNICSYKSTMNSLPAVMLLEKQSVSSLTP